MNQLQRKEYILKHLEQHKSLRVRALAKQMEISEVTLRNDLIALESAGLIVRTHGGALLTSGMQGTELPSMRKTYQNADEKRKIGVAAASMIRNNEIIILDSGSTTLEIARNIKSANVTVVTNDVQIAMVLAGKQNVKLFMPGGEAMSSVYTLVGDNTVNYFKALCADKVFLGCDAMDIEKGITNRTFREVAVKQAMMTAAKERIVVVDHSKFDKQVFVKICPFEEVNCVITGSLPSSYRIRLKECGVNLVEVN